MGKTQILSSLGFWFLCLPIFCCLGCGNDRAQREIERRQAEIENEQTIRECKQRGFRVDRFEYVEYTSPNTIWEKKTLEISNKTGVPLERVRSIYEAEGRAAATQTIRDNYGR
jgi:hypothetical protein